MMEVVREGFLEEGARQGQTTWLLSPGILQSRWAELCSFSSPAPTCPCDLAFPSEGIINGKCLGGLEEAHVVTAAE